MNDFPLYAKYPAHRANNEEFRKLMAEYPWIEFFRPSPFSAPWHIKCVIGRVGSGEIHVNFWPHVAKAHRDGHKGVQGWKSIRAMLEQVIEDSHKPEPRLIE